MSSLALRNASRLAAPLVPQAFRASAAAVSTVDATNAQNTQNVATLKIQNFNVYRIQFRSFGRKAGKMGQHLKNLDEIAHRENRKKKGKKSKHNDDVGAATTSFEVEDITLAEDENETKFDHGGNDGDGDEETPSLPSEEDVQQRMMKVVNAMEESFRSIRGAEPSPELFDSVQVKAYGAMTPLNAVGQVVITSPTMATISCFDPDTCSSVRDAVRDMAGMNFNPRVEDGAVIVPIPRVSAETRKVCAKQI